MNRLIVTALKAEALPIIHTFNLKKDPETHLYWNSNICLCIIGVGSRKIKDRISTLMEAQKTTGDCILFNIGIAGGNPRSTSIGEIYLINMIHNESTHKVYLPDILIKHGLKEINLTTVNKGIVDGSGLFNGLVDMEAAHLFETASSWLPPHRMVFLKVVSDYMDIQDWKTLDVKALILAKMDIICKTISAWDTPLLADRVILDKEDRTLLSTARENLRLTETQNHQLIDRAEGYKIRTGLALEGMEPYSRKKSTSKQERNSLFNELCSFLSA